jgi:hypothetical protein
MTPQETVNLKVDDEFFIVIMSNSYDFNNPFIRTCKSGRSKYYKPLGVFKTKVTEITEKSSIPGNANTPTSYYVEGKIDTSEFEHLIWRGRWDELPEGKEFWDYAGHNWCSYDFYANFQNPFGDNNSTSNCFFTKEEAQQYYEKNLKKFNKDVKTYIAHIKNEIELANKNIINAQNQLKKYESII